MAFGNIGRGFRNALAIIFQAGNRVIINGNGLFVYNGVPTLGNLIISETATAGTDPFGNVYKQGVTVYNGGQSVELQATGGVALQNFFSGSVNEISPGQLKAGDAGGSLQFIIGAPQATGSTDGAFINLTSSDGTPNFSKGFLAYQKSGPGADQNLFSWGADGVYRASLANLVGGVGLTQMDSFRRTITTSGFQQITNTYSIPANDPTLASLQQTIYQIEAIGFGTWPTPTQILGFQGLFKSLTLLFINVPGDTAGNGFNWKLRYRVVILTTGVTGTCQVSGEVSVLNASTGASYFTGPIVDSNVETIDTTTSGTFQLQAGWQTGGNGATMTCVHSIFDRIGA